MLNDKAAEHGSAPKPRKDSVTVVLDGKRVMLHEFARDMQVVYHRLYYFVVQQGMEPRLAVERIRSKKKLPIEVTHEGRSLPLTEFALAMGVSYRMLYARVRFKSLDPHAAVEEIRSITNRPRSANFAPSRGQFVMTPQELRERFRMISQRRFDGLRDYTPAKRIHRCRATRRVLRVLQDF